MSREDERRRRHLSEDDHALWEQVTRAVAPLKRRKPAATRADPEQPKAPPAKQPRTAKPVPVVTPARAPELKPPALAPIERRLRQKLSRGTREIDDRIDLHGMTQAQAHHALTRFLHRAQAHGARVVLVITGKGKRGDDGERERGVLRRQVPQWLGMPELRGIVIGFEEAAIGHGGEGALYVRVRRARGGE